MWEYLYKTFSGISEEAINVHLNTLGVDGWELVSWDFSHRHGVFKRPKQQHSE